MGPQQASVSIAVASKEGLLCAAGNFFFFKMSFSSKFLSMMQKKIGQILRESLGLIRGGGGGVWPQNMGGPWPLWPRPTTSLVLVIQVEPLSIKIGD